MDNWRIRHDWIGPRWKTIPYWC